MRMIIMLDENDGVHEISIFILTLEKKDNYDAKYDFRRVIDN